MNKLPDCAFVIMPASKRAVAIVRNGRMGHSVLAEFPSEDAAAWYVDDGNKRLGVSPPQVMALQAGSMFGFDHPLADPAAFNDQGVLSGNATVN